MNITDLNFVTVPVF